MDWIREWLTGITGAALVGAILSALLPDGPVKKVGKLGCGLLLMAAMLRPLGQADHRLLAGGLNQISGELSHHTAQNQIASYTLMEIIIQDKTAAYIVDKAAGLGITCTAQVTCETDESGVPCPVGVTITGVWTQAQQDDLTEIIEVELAIGREGQRYESEEVK